MFSSSHQFKIIYKINNNNNYKGQFNNLINKEKYKKKIKFKIVNN